MAEYASKGAAGTALGLGIAGTVGLVNQLGNCGGCGNGLLGGLFGGNNCCNRGVGGLAEVQYVSALQVENDQLKAENYRVTIARLEEQIKCAGEKAELREQVIQGQLREQGLALNGKIDQVASAAKCCCEANSADIASLQALVDKITQTNVPLSAICPEVMARYNSWTAPTSTPTQA